LTCEREKASVALENSHDAHQGENQNDQQEDNHPDSASACRHENP
jgi:hypothetical protein